MLATIYTYVNLPWIPWYTVLPPIAPTVFSKWFFKTNSSIKQHKMKCHNEKNNNYPVFIKCVKIILYITHSLSKIFSWRLVEIYDKRWEELENSGTGKAHVIRDFYSHFEVVSPTTIALQPTTTHDAMVVDCTEQIKSFPMICVSFLCYK